MAKPKAGGKNGNTSNKKRLLTKLVKSGSVEDVREKLWQGIVKASTILQNEENPPDVQLRAIHALTQAAGNYAKLIEATEFEKRLAELEEHSASGGGAI